MIKNVVFDFGQVLVRFDPLYMVKKHVAEENDARLIAEVLFDRLYWDRLDAGTIPDEEVISLSKARLPQRLADKVEEIYYNWIYNLPQIPGMRELLKHLKEVYGVKLFLLSNISAYFAKHSGEMEILRDFDKCIFSALCKKVKPNKDIYAHLCSECDISPDETVFIDDNAGNISGAEDFGILTYLFDGDAERLKDYLDKLLKDRKIIV